MNRSFFKKAVAFTAALMMSFASVPLQEMGISAVTIGTSVEATDTVIIDEAHFPDAFFRNKVRTILKKNEGDTVSADEFAAITTISCNSSNITSLKGIEYFTEITLLSCYGNKLKELDVSKNTKLKNLYCYNNNIHELDLSMCPYLERIECNNNLLSDLNIKGLSKITIFCCQNNMLTELDMSASTEMLRADVSGNPLKKIDISMFSKLKEFSANSTGITEIDLSGNSKLTKLYLADNCLTSLNISNLTELTSLHCYANRLTSLDLSSNSKLQSVYCYDNELTEVITEGSNISTLSCSDNRLKTAYLPGGGTLICCNNQLVHCGSKSNSSAYNVSGNKYPIALVDGKAYLDQLTYYGFDISRVRSWNDAVYNESDNTVTFLNGKECSFVYYFGPALNGINTETFYLVDKFTPIDSEIFPDPAFRAYVADLFGRKEGDVISDEQFYSVREMDISGLGISDLTGIEYFTNLWTLNCSNNNLVSLDISNNPRLRELDCSDNQLPSVDISNNLKLGKLNCSGNLIEALDISANTNLIELNCGRNNITSLTTGSSSLLEILDISENPIVKLNIQNLKRLVYLNLDGNNKLMTINYSGNYILEHIECSNANQYSIDLSNNIFMKTLVCCESGLSQLRVDNCSRLEKLCVSNNQLVGFRVNSEFLTELECSENVRLMEFTDGAASATFIVNGKYFLPEYVSEWYSGGFDEESSSFVLNGADSCSYRYCVGSGSNGTTLYGDFTVADENAAGISFLDVVAQKYNIEVEEMTDEFFSSVTSLDVSNMNISDMNGIEKFINLEYLNCGDNQIKSIDVSSNTKLSTLYAYNNLITKLELGDSDELLSLDISLNANLGSLDVSKKTNLITLACGSCGLSELDLTNNIKLGKLYCDFNQLTTLDIENCTLLNLLDCTGNQITGELDLRDYSNMVCVDCGNNEISSILIDGLTQLEKLHIYENKLTEIDVSTNKNLKIINCGKNYISELDLSSNTELEYLACYECNLTTLDIGMLDKLASLDCSNNPLSTLDVTKNILLEELCCRNNNLTSIDISKNKKLITLDCESNSLSKLDLSQNSELELLYCRYNYLNSLDVSMLPKLSVCMCEDNNFKINCSGKTISVSMLTKYGFDPSKVISWNGIEYKSAANTISFVSNAEEYSYLYDCGNGITCLFKITPIIGSGGSTENQEIINVFFNGTDIEVIYFDLNTGAKSLVYAAAEDITIYMVDVMDIQDCIELVNYLFDDTSSESIILTDGQLALIERVLEWDCF